jgi:hypothetical protein
MKTALLWYARLVDTKGAGQAAVAIDLQVFDRTANGWVRLASAASSVTGLLRGKATLENDSPILAPALRLVEQGAAVVLSANARLAVGEGGAVLNVDFGELTRLPENLRFVPPRGAMARVPDDPFVVGALVGPSAAAIEPADNAALRKALQEQIRAEVGHEYETRIAKALQDHATSQALADRRATELAAVRTELQRLVALPGGTPPVAGGSVKVSDFASTIGTEIGSAQQALRRSGYSLGAISLSAKTLVDADGTVRFLNKDELKGVSGRSLSDLVLQFRPDDSTAPSGSLRVPDVRQLTESAARRILASVGLGLEPHLGSRDIRPDCAPGQAMLQAPAAGQPAVPGARVMVVFAQDNP